MPRPLGSHDATALAVLHAALGGAAGWLLVARQPRLAGIAVIAAAVAGLGALWLAERSGSARAAFAGEAAERVLDAATLAPLVWVAQASSPRTAALGLAALGLGAVASYQRARGASLGFPVPRWPAYRAIRTILLGGGLLLSRPAPFLVAVVALDTLVMMARWRIVARAPA